MLIIFAGSDGTLLLGALPNTTTYKFSLVQNNEAPPGHSPRSVSYTHLDVYKRQAPNSPVDSIANQYYRRKHPCFITTSVPFAERRIITMKDEEKIAAGILFCPTDEELKKIKLKTHNLNCLLYTSRCV